MINQPNSGFSSVESNPASLVNNPTVTFTRTDNAEVIGNRITLTQVIGGVTYTQLIKKNAALEILQITAWA